MNTASFPSGKTRLQGNQLHDSRRHNYSLFFSRTVLIACLFITTVSRLQAAAPPPIPDKEISVAVRRELGLSDAISSHLISVTTANGVVTLSGSVNHLLAAEQAVALAKSIKGVRAVVNQLTVDPVKRSDNEIRRDVISALSLDPVAEAYELTVEADDGNVQLGGTVESWAEKRLSEMVVKSVKGVRGITNTINVHYATSRSDEDIFADIQRRLELDPYLDHEFLTVTVAEGNVTVTGEVGNALQKTYVKHDCLVAGVGKVNVSGIDVRWWTNNAMQRSSKFVSKPDEEIEEAVADAFLWDTRIAADEIDIAVEDGVVVLTGTVDNVKTKRVAERDAQNTIGVVAVKNHLRVIPPDISDAEIEKNVAQALLWDPVVERHEIDPVVRNKKVYLYGSVDNGYEKQKAEETTSRVYGVADVDNFLMVRDEWQWASDNFIQKAIQEQIEWNSFITADNITVSVEGGIAELKGKVHSNFAREAAVREGFDGGAKSIVCRLQVNGPPREPEYRAYKKDEYEIVKHYIF